MLNFTEATRITTEKIRAHLQETVEATHRRELVEAEQATTWQDRQRLREAAEAAHAVRLGKIDELAASFADIEGRGTATSVFQEMTRIMAGQGVDEAIAYVAGQRANILQTIRARAAATRERNRADLQPLLKAAALHESKGQPGEARALYNDVLSAEPDWPDALHAYFWFLIDQGDAALVHTTLADALREYDEARRLALRLTAGDPGNTSGSATCRFLRRLGDVAVAQGKLDDAARAYRDGLAIMNKLAAGDPGNTQWQRDLSVSYNKLGDVAVAQGKLDDAARAYREAWRLRTSWRRATPATPSGSATCRFPTTGSATWRWRKASWMTRHGLTVMAWRLGQAGGGRPRQHPVAARPVGFLRQARRRGGGARQAG